MAIKRQAYSSFSQGSRYPFIEYAHVTCPWSGCVTLQLSVRVRELQSLCPTPAPSPNIFLSSFLFLINWGKLTCQLSHEGVVRINEIIFFKYSEIS